MGRLLTVIALFLTLAVSLAAQQPRQFTPPRPVVHQAKYASMDCGFVNDPEPTNSPNPMILNAPTTVDVIIGADGRPHSALILQSSGSQVQDRELLTLIGSWRFRPSLCNNAPSPSEASIVFVP